MGREGAGCRAGPPASHAPARAAAIEYSRRESMVTPTQAPCPRSAGCPDGMGAASVEAAQPGCACALAGELLRKYGAMLAMRLAHDAGMENPTQVRPQMVALAARFPGALRELDELELDEIRRRIARIEGVLSGACRPEPWMRAMAAFHALARGALCAKRWLVGRKHVDDAIERGYVDALQELAFPEDARAWKDDLRSVASPPRGRLTSLVFARLAQALGITEREARGLVFGRIQELDAAQQ